MPKILFFIDSMSGGGAERVCSLLANHFSTLQYETTVVTIEQPKPTDYFLEQSVCRKSLRASHKSRHLFQALFNNCRLVVKLRREFQRSDPDIVISFMTPANVVCALACIKIGAKHIASERNHPPSENTGRFWHTLRRYTYYLPETVVAQTEKTEDWLRTNTYTRKTTVIPNPIVYPLKKPSSQEDLSQSVAIKKPILLGVGRLVKQKQFSELILAFSNIAADIPDWTLTIIGEGPERVNLEKLIRTVGLESRILLPGKQSGMWFWYENAEIFALTSKYEGYPNALLEAMCHGVAPISYDCDTGPSTMIENRMNGILVPANNRKALENGILKLARSKELRRGYSDKAKNILQKHQMEIIGAQWESLFETT